MKELVLKVKHIDWSMMGPGDWNNTEWKIYSDLTVEILVSYNPMKNQENNKIVNSKLERKSYDKIFEKINLVKENDINVDACDGSVWEIIQYENGNAIWKREKGYIYGIKSLEKIATILNNLIKD